MSLFPELEGMGLDTLKELFMSNTLQNDYLTERDILLQEVAVRIAKSGYDGLSFLIQSIPNADESRLRAILLSFSFLSPAVSIDMRRELKDILLASLKYNHPMLIAEAIDTLNSLNFVEVKQDVLHYLEHKSPYVVGSVLRYISKHDPDRAKPILLDNLKSEDPIILQNAIDELDRLNCYEAAPYIRPLQEADDKYVRQAAITALSNLEQKNV
jgi:HEAT repeat protein